MSRFRSFPWSASDRTDVEGESVEEDAIELDRLWQIVRECIELHVDRRALAALRVAERSEREVFTRLIEQLGDDGTMPI